MDAQEINLHINELILDGWSPLAEQILRESIANTLAELIEKNPLPNDTCLQEADLSALASIDLSPKASASPQQLGKEIGMALFKRLQTQAA